MSRNFMIEKINELLSRLPDSTLHVVLTFVRHLGNNGQTWWNASKCNHHDSI